MFNGTVVAKDGKKVLIDPVPCEGKVLKELENLGPFSVIYLTNKDHERMAYDLRRRWKIPIWIHEKDKALLKETSEGTFADAQSLECDLEVIHLSDQKSPGECALYLRARGILILGDALIGVPKGSLGILPAEKYRDVLQAKASLERLCL